jgi:hypothetical protein
LRQQQGNDAVSGELMMDLSPEEMKAFQVEYAKYGESATGWFNAWAM